MIIWLTGAPGAGKTTIARALALAVGSAAILDGDDVRTWLTPDCDYSTEGRLRHAWRVWNVARLINRVGGTAIVALMAHPPLTVDFPVDLLVWVDGPPRKPLWPGTTYQPPSHFDLRLDTEGLSVEECALAIIKRLPAFRVVA